MALSLELLFLAVVLLPFFPANGQLLLAVIQRHSSAQLLQRGNGGGVEGEQPTASPVPTLSLVLYQKSLGVEGVRVTVFCDNHSVGRHATLQALYGFLKVKPEGPSLASLSTTQTQVQKEIVNKHNELRRSVSPPASNMLKMEWDKEAAANAQKWANKCTLEHSNAKDRKTSTSCGENLYMSSHPKSWSVPIQAWYDENTDFIYGKGPKTPGAVVGHYTQVVWYSSHRIGCGMAYCSNQANLKYYYVCQYCPAGNFRNKINTPYLEGKPCASCPNHCNNGLCTNVCKYEDKYQNCNTLKEMLTCDTSIPKDNCKASCNCQDKIY